MGKADVRYYLNSQFVSFTDKSINTAVSDGYRLVTDKLDVPCKHLIDVLIPRNAVEILSIIDADVDVYVRYTKEGNLSVIEFNGVDFALYVTPINSKYPSFDRLMAQYVNNKLTTVTVKRKEMLKGLKANLSNLLSVDKSKGVTVILDGNDLLFHDIADHEKKTLFSVKANHDNNTKGIQIIGRFECNYLIDLLTIEKANDVEIIFTEMCAVIEKANGYNIAMGQRH
jgi:DNA polymerase III sliding clamp (beta) subunit (PCNA family)